MTRSTLLLLGLICVRSTFGQALDHTILPLQTPGGFVTTEDLVGLIVSVPETTELVYFNTSTEQETKRVELEFKPGAMCRQGKLIYVAQHGSALVHALDMATAKTQKTYELGGDAVAALACSEKGPVFVSTASRKVHVIDVEAGEVQETSAVGLHLGITPDGKWLFTGLQPKESEFDYKVSERPEGRIQIPWDGTWGPRAQILKYKINDNELQFDSVQNNAASNGWSFALSPDGARVTMPGGGGWRPVDGGRGEYATAIFSTSNLKTMLGQAPHATAITFHPVLDLGMTHHSGRTIHFFRAKSLKKLKELEVAKDADGSPVLFTFGGKGTKAILWNGHNPATQLAGLHFLPLDLSDAEQQALVKAYGKLPSPVEVAANLPDELSEEPAKPEAEPPKPATSPVKPTRSKPPRVSRTDPEPKFKPAAKVPMRTGGTKPSDKEPKEKAPTEAIAAFNDTKGLQSNKQRFSPYPVGARGQAGGLGEAGWAGPWMIPEPLLDSVSYVDDPVQEGDGALYVAPAEGQSHSGLLRTLAQEWKGKFEIEQYVRVPENGHVYVYIGESEHATGPMWGVMDGKISALHGSGEQFGQNSPVYADIEIDPEKWYKVLLRIDVDSHTYEFFVDDKQIGDKPLGFRAKIAAIKEYRLLTEKPGGFLLDAIHVRQGETTDR